MKTTKKLFLYLPVFLLLSISSVQAQPYVKIDTVLNNQIEYTGDNSIEISLKLVSKTYKNDLYVAYVKNKKLIIEKFTNDKSIVKSNLSIVKLKGKFKNLGSYSLKDIAIDMENNEAYILTFGYVMVISLTENRVKDYFPISDFGYLFSDNEHLYLGRYYDYHPNDSKNKAGLFKYTKQGKVLDSILLEVPFIEYTHYIPNQLFTFNGQSFVMPLFDSYTLLAINKDFKSIDTFSFAKENWVSPSIEVSNSFKANFDQKDRFYRILDNENYKRISRIEFVEFTDNNELMVRYFQFDPSNTLSSNQRYIDRYKFTKGNFVKLQETQIETPKLDPNLPMKQGHVNLNSNSIVSHYFNDGFIYFRFDVPVEITSAMTEVEYKEIKNEQVAKNNPAINIWFFRYE
ncbi:MAG: hypothetical protein J5I91_02310 [Bacteroidetes bacterium]|nr:hypothetical protein [Bacteroidota bacterium]